MTGPNQGWSGPARPMVAAVNAALEAAQAGDPDDFAAAILALGRLDSSQVTVLLGAMVRDLLERSHPDGLDSDDAHEVLESCVRFAQAWYRELDADSAVQALIGALGVSDVDEMPGPDEMSVVAHGVLLIADQLAILAQDLAPVLDAALAELMRAQTVELP
jgi:hypothetical protein